MKETPAVAITVVSRNYFHFAVAMYESLKETNPSVPLIVYLLDEFPADFEHPQSTRGLALADESGFRIVKASEIGIETWARMSFQYTPFELACAVKPFATKHALQNFGDRVLYCDADLEFVDSVGEVIERLDTCNVLLTPHFISTANTAGRRPACEDARYASIAQAGAFNAGFYAVRNTGETTSFLNWWCERCRSQCYVSPTTGIFVDQSWLNFAPTLFPNVRIDRTPQLNVAYWNLSRRKLRQDSDERWVVGDEARPVTFFHFSGFDLEAPERLTKYHHPGTYDTTEYSELAKSYLARVKSKNPELYSALGCQFDTFNDGTPISPLWREAFRGNAPELAGFGDPWDYSEREALSCQLSELENRSVVARLPWHLEELDKMNRTLNQQLEELAREPQQGLVKSLIRKFVPRNQRRAVA